MEVRGTEVAVAAAVSSLQQLLERAKQNKNSRVTKALPL